MVKPDKIIRSRRRTLSISIDAFGRLIVRAPIGYGEERIFAFLRRKEDWILKHQSEAKGAGLRLPPENLDGYRFLLLGKEHVVRLYDGAAIRYDSERMEIFVPIGNTRESPRKSLTAWLKRNAKNIFSKTVARRAAEMGATYKSVSVTSAKTRWGSCSAQNAINFSFRLLYAPPEVIDYVAVHELAHVFEKNHSKRFWAIVEKYLPDYRQKQAWLKEHRIVMEIF